jgi:predicted RNase H-like nuclease
MSLHPGSCVGVDGAKSGWVGVWRVADGLDFDVYISARRVVDAHRGATVIAVDIPIGLSDCGGRLADSLARGFVGGKRASSVFSTPVRGILDAQTQPEASRRHFEIDGRKFGAHSFAILPKIREWDDLLRTDTEACKRVREIHPEVSFAALAGGMGLPESKRTPEGASVRKALLSPVFGHEVVDSLLARVPRQWAATDDVLDALVALWSAERIARGEARTLPEPAVIDSCGMICAIHY